MSNSIIWLLPMEFIKRLITLRKEQGLTQQSLADSIEIHVNQIKRYEAGTAQPTLETLVRLSKALHTTLDDLVFGEDFRTPNDELKLQFEALSQFDDDERKTVKDVLESLILKHNAKRAFADQIREA